MMRPGVIIVLIVILSAVYQFPVTVRAQITDDLEGLNLQLERLSRQGRYTEAVPIAEKILSLTKDKYGPGHAKTATALNDLAYYYRVAGRYTEAESLFKKALEIRTKVLGEEHPDVAQSMNSLAILYAQTERIAEAESLLNRALEIRKKALGEEHPDVAQSMNDLAAVYTKTERYEEAESVLNRALEISKKVLGEEHPDVATNRYYLAILFGITGRYEEAESLFKKALEVREKVLGEDHINTAKIMGNLASLYWQMGRFGEAETLFGKDLAISEKVLGQEHPDVAKTMFYLAVVYARTGRYEEAESLLDRCLEISEKVLNKDHPDVAKIRKALAPVYFQKSRLLTARAKGLDDSGKYAEAIPYAEKALELDRKSLTEEHPAVAESMKNLAVLYARTERYEEAETLLDRALEITKKVLGEEHAAVAEIKRVLALVYLGESRLLTAKAKGLFDSGKYAEAIPYAEKALELDKKSLTEEHPAVAESMKNLAVLYARTERYDEAESLLDRALAISKKVPVEDYPDVAQIRMDLALLYSIVLNEKQIKLEALGKYSEVIPYAERALELSKKALGVEDEYVATSMLNLALAYSQTGRYDKAESLYKQALEIRKKVYGEESKEAAKIMHNLASLYWHMGRYEEAETLFRPTLEIRKKILGEKDTDVAKTMQNFASVYRETGRSREAEDLLNGAMEIRKNALPENHPDVAQNMVSLAELFLLMERYGEAEPLLVRALEIRKKALGPEHPYVAESMVDLGLLYYLAHRHEEAKDLLNGALEIKMKVLGDEHHSVQITLDTLARLYAATGDHRASHGHFYRSSKITDKLRENMTLSLSERQQLTYMKQNERYIHLYLTHTSQYLRSNSAAIVDTLNAWLRWKGAVSETQGRLTEACSQSKNPDVQKNCHELIDVRRTLASLMLSTPGEMDMSRYRNFLSDLNQKKSDLEVELGRLSQDFRLEKLVDKADIQSIASILPKESAYLDFAAVRPYDFKYKKFEEKTRYLVFVLIPSNPPRVVFEDLGDTEAIDWQIRDYHKVIREAVNSKPRRVPNIDTLERHLKALYGLVMAPLLPHIKDIKHLFISPDGSLNLIPFEAFVTPEGKYLLEEDVSINYIAAGRDIVRFKDEARAQGKPLILADPDYDLEEQKRIEVARQMGVSEVEIRGGPSRDAGGLSFKRLPDTRKEAETIRKTLKQGEATCREDKEALQEVLFAAQYPKVLHIATHGYFLPDQKITPQLGPGRDILPPEVLKAYENPMLRSGIALAGANTSQRQGKDYGMVSAEKVLGLKLKGTDLVVLSACETGVGDIQTGEGVFGLKRAFILSGARTVVMSLWSVPSKETTQLMGLFYTKWAGGATKAEALREAKRELMKVNPNPFFWGAFVMVGDPGK